MMWNSLWSQDWFCIHPGAGWSVSSVNLLGINHLFQCCALDNEYQICSRQLCTSCIWMKTQKVILVIYLDGIERAVALIFEAESSPCTGVYLAQIGAYGRHVTFTSRSLSGQEGEAVSAHVWIQK